MLFKNTLGKKIKVRFDNGTLGDRKTPAYFFRTIKENEKVELPEHYGLNLGFEPLEKRLAEQLKEKPKDSVIESKKGKEGKFSKTDLIDLKKSQQVKILKDFGLSDKEIKKLNNETKRVKKILKLQNAKNN